VSFVEEEREEVIERKERNPKPCAFFEFNSPIFNNSAFYTQSYTHIGRERETSGESE